ncbi:MAG: hypothetical protein ACTSPS_14480 [Promethearchaeota archaeon]
MEIPEPKEKEKKVDEIRESAKKEKNPILLFGWPPYVDINFLFGWSPYEK